MANMAVVPRTPEPRRCRSESPVFAATPEALAVKGVSPGPKLDPLDRAAHPIPDAPSEPVVERLTSLRNSLLDKSDDQMLEDSSLRLVFNYDAVYGVLGSTVSSMDSAVYALFSMMFKGFGTKDQFGAQDAYRFYEKFPVDACSTVLGTERCKTIAQKLRVDPHYVRFGGVLTFKMLLPRAWNMLFASGQRQSAKESVMMLGGTNMKKSTLLKFWRKLLRNSQNDLVSPGINEELARLGFKRRKKRESEKSEKEDDEGQDEEQPQFVEEEQLFWYFYNPRMTYEGLIDLGNLVYTDGPRLHLAIDELSLCVSGVSGKKMPGCLSIDEYILICDDEAECSKGAVTATRRLIDPFFTSLVGVQMEVLPDILGSNSGRNVLSRYTVVGTEEHRALEELTEDVPRSVCGDVAFRF